MSEPGTLLAGLREIRTPDAEPAAALPDGAAALSLGLAAALLLAGAARLLARRPPDWRARLRVGLAAARSLPAEERLLAQVRLLKDLEPGEGQAWLAALDRRFGTDVFTRGEAAGLADLYRPGLRIDPDRLDAALRRLAARAPRIPRVGPGRRAAGGDIPVRPAPAADTRGTA
ncbi:hypothetical protein [Prosthecomicrobium sp. N25]|uniref:hypothetical protein n=1 Tax=Prosthecomicrobium sp. N25 TaxID=3129254 RepID=UPI0030772924